jgi:hypothetical protein
LKGIRHRESIFQLSWGHVRRAKVPRRLDKVKSSGFNETASSISIRTCGLECGSFDEIHEWQEPVPADTESGCLPNLTGRRCSPVPCPSSKRNLSLSGVFIQRRKRICLALTCSRSLSGCNHSKKQWIRPSMRWVLRINRRFRQACPRQYPTSGPASPVNRESLAWSGVMPHRRNADVRVPGSMGRQLCLCSRPYSLEKKTRWSGF